MTRQIAVGQVVKLRKPVTHWDSGARYVVVEINADFAYVRPQEAPTVTLIFSLNDLIAA